MHFSSTLALTATLLATVSATATHNWWLLPDDLGDIAQAESSIRVPKGSDPQTTYWMANGWSGGYMGMQHNSGTTRTILFSVWDDGHGGKVDEIEIGEGVKVEPFGGEGTGRHAQFHYNWTAGETIYFRVKAKVNEDLRSADYTGWWRPAAQNDWKLLATFRRENVPQWLHSLYGFLENFGSNGSQIREGFWGNFTVTDTDGKTGKPIGMKFDHTTPGPGSNYGYKIVNGEAYQRTDGPKDQGLYPPTNPPETYAWF